MKLLIKIIIFELLNVLVGAESPLDFLSKFNQHDYELKFERIELGGYDPSIVKQAKVVTFKYNRTTTLCNITLEYYKDLGKNVHIVIQVYKFLSNEYREFPIRYRVNFCDTIESDMFGLNAGLQCGNISASSIYKNRVYYVCNFQPDASKFPPFIPSGSFMVELNFIATRFSSNNPYLTIKAYGTVHRFLD